MQDEEIDAEGKYDLCHFASRTESLREAWLEDVNNEHKVVQLSVKNIYRRCKLWSRKSPEWLTIFLVAVSNVGNVEARVQIRCVACMTI